VSDKKSKIPSLEEFGKYVGKLFTDIKDSVKEIVTDYQKNHPGDDDTAESKGEEKEAKADKKPAKKAPPKKDTEESES
jgi:Sec-independent protein translocase protein TatA